MQAERRSVKAMAELFFRQSVNCRPGYKSYERNWKSEQIIAQMVLVRPSGKYKKQLVRIFDSLPFGRNFPPEPLIRPSTRLLLTSLHNRLSGNLFVRKNSPFSVLGSCWINLGSREGFHLMWAQMTALFKYLENVREATVSLLKKRNSWLLRIVPRVPWTCRNLQNSNFEWFEQASNCALGTDNNLLWNGGRS